MKSEVEDWLTELPPLDGADDEPTADDGAGEDLLPGLDADTSLDDAAADDLVVDDGVDISDDEPGSAEDDDRWEADVGEPDLDLADGDDSEPLDADTPALGESDLDLADELPASEDDAGEEGTTDPVEHSLDEELPALDADDEGDFEDVLLLETGIEPAPQHALRWADAAWKPRAPVCRSLSWDLADGDAVVAMAMRNGPDLCVSVTLHGRLLVASDLGAKAPRVRDVSAHLPAFARAGEPLLLALSNTGRPLLSVASPAGQIAQSTDLGQSWTVCAGAGRPILGLATHENGSISVLAQTDLTTELLTSADGARWFKRSVSAEVHVAPRPHRRVEWLAVHGAAVAIGDALGVCVSRDGRHFVKIPGSIGATAGTFAGEMADAPLIFAADPAADEEKVRLIRVLHDGTAEIVAEIAPPAGADEPTDAPGVFALRWDTASRGIAVAFPTLVAMWGQAVRELV